VREHARSDARLCGRRGLRRGIEEVEADRIELVECSHELSASFEFEDEKCVANLGPGASLFEVRARVTHFFFFALFFLFCFLLLAACLFCSAFKRSLASAS